jgi:hypothetical protein
MTDRFLFQLPQFSSGLRIFLANEAIDHVGLDLAGSYWVNPNARLGEFEGHHLDLSPPLRASTRYRYDSMRHCFGRRFGELNCGDGRCRFPGPSESVLNSGPDV